VFGETVTFGRLLEATSDPAARLALLAESLEGQIATVFRQVAMNRFENRVHTQRREQGELSVEQFNEAWEATQHTLLGDTVEITPGYRTWWSYIPHFMGTPGYVYAYAYGQLLALSVYRLYEAQRRLRAAVPELLAAGGSRSPRSSGASSASPRHPGFWDGGSPSMAEQLDAASGPTPRPPRLTGALTDCDVSHHRVGPASHCSYALPSM
jgi:oligoendopeptidase F